MTIAHVKARVQEITSSVIGRDVEENEPLMDAGLDSLSGQEMKQRIEDEFEIDLRRLRRSISQPCATWPHSSLTKSGQLQLRRRDHILRLLRRRLQHELSLFETLTLSHYAHPTQTVFAAFRFIGGTTTFIRRQCKSITLIARSVTICTLHPSADLFQIISSLIHTPSISTLEALYMDVQQRSLLEGTLQSISGGAHSHGDALDAATSCTGVYVGIASCDYADEVLRRYEHALHPYLVSGTSLNVAAGRISYVFNFRGPSVSVDTACSSSIVTTHTAASGMKSGEMARALSCGVQAILSEHITGVFHSSGMIAPDGRCKTLDSCADGYVRAEARGVLAMETLSEDEMMNVNDVVVAGTAVNQDGRSSSLTAPNGPTQKVVIRTAATIAGVTSSSVGVLQLHGTGTALATRLRLAPP